MPIRSSSEKHHPIHHPGKQTGKQSDEAPSQSSPPASPDTDQQNENQKSSFIGSIVDKTMKALLAWYPPVFLHNHPEIRESLSKLSPTVKTVLDLEEKAYNETENFFQSTSP